VRAGCWGCRRKPFVSERRRSPERLLNVSECDGLSDQRASSEALFRAMEVVSNNRGPARTPRIPKLYLLFDLLPSEVLSL
jgi:hypothetical protein